MVPILFLLYILCPRYPLLAHLPRGLGAVVLHSAVLYVGR